jgi:hypothetical protein
MQPSIFNLQTLTKVYPWIEGCSKDPLAIFNLQSSIPYSRARRLLEGPPGNLQSSSLHASWSRVRRLLEGPPGNRQSSSPYSGRPPRRPPAGDDSFREAQLKAALHREAVAAGCSATAARHARLSSASAAVPPAKRSSANPFPAGALRQTRRGLASSTARARRTGRAIATATPAACLASLRLRRTLGNRQPLIFAPLQTPVKLVSGSKTHRSRARRLLEGLPGNLQS